MKSITSEDTDREFPVPPGIVFTQIDRTTGGLATPFCPDDVVMTQAFKAGTQPGLPCPKHEPHVPEPDCSNSTSRASKTFTNRDSRSSRRIFRSEPAPPPPPTDTDLRLPSDARRIDTPQPEMSPRQKLPPIETTPRQEPERTQTAEHTSSTCDAARAGRASGGPPSGTPAAATAAAATATAGSPAGAAA